MEKKNLATAISKITQSLMLLLVVLMPIISSSVYAQVDFNQDLSAADEAAFDQMLSPVMKIYNFVKYAASVVAVVIMLFAGISYMVSGADVKKRDNSKQMAGYVVMGLLVVWMAPIGINYLVG